MSASDEFVSAAPCDNAGAALTKDGRPKMKTGRKSGYRMPSWNKALLASRRDCLELEAINAVLRTVGEALTAAVSGGDAEFFFTAPNGCRKNLLLVGKNSKHAANQRSFLFTDLDTGFRVNFVTQEIYDGLVSGTFSPESESVRERLYRILADSPEVRESVKQRAAKARSEAKSRTPGESLKRDLFYGDGDTCAAPSVSVEKRLLGIVRRVEREARLAAKSRREARQVCGGSAE